MAGREFLGQYTLTVEEGVFPLGGDALALGAFATVKNGWRVCDLGTGSGCLLLLLAQRAQGLSLTGVEREAAAAESARENLRRNGLAGEVYQADWNALPAALGGCHLVISNPPYFQPGRGKSGGSAREESGSLEELCRTAVRLLRCGGRFALCHRPERLCDLMCALRASALEPKRMQMVRHAAGYPPSCVLLEAVYQGGAGLTVLPDLLRSEETQETIRRAGGTGGV